MIIFIGSEEHGFFLQEANVNEEINYTGYVDLDNIKECAIKDASSCIIIDITQWSEKSDLIADKINSIASTTRSKIIIYAVGFSLNSLLCSSLMQYGINRIITAGNLSDIKSEFLRFYNNEDYEVIEKISMKNPEPELNTTMVITIAVAGSQNRIGTTTQCFQIVKHLSAKGFRAAYLEFNKTNYLQKMKKLFGLSSDDFFFEGINVYSADQINRVLKEYDYIVYDYGSITDSSFNQYSFLEKSKYIIICGATPSEIEYSTTALNLFQNNSDIIYIFNFVPKSDEEDITALMGNHQVYFSPLIPDMFTVLLEQQKLYDKFLTLRASPSMPKKKKSFFKFGRNE